MADLTRKMRKDMGPSRSLQRDALCKHRPRRLDEGDSLPPGEQNVRDHILADHGRRLPRTRPEPHASLGNRLRGRTHDRALASTFGEVHGVDVSEDMVQQAKHFLRSTPNANVYRNSGKDLRVLGDLQFDFAYSFIVFQHIPSRAVIDNYVGAVSRCLRSGSIFKFQVQGHQSPSMREPRRDTWLGASISESEAAAMAERHGFELQRSGGAGTQYYWLWFYKP